MPVSRYADDELDSVVASRRGGDVKQPAPSDGSVGAGIGIGAGVWFNLDGSMGGDTTLDLRGTSSGVEIALSDWVDAEETSSGREAVRADVGADLLGGGLGLRGESFAAGEVRGIAPGCAPLVVMPDMSAVLILCGV